MAIKFTWSKLPVDENGKAYDSLDDFKRAMLDKALAIETKGEGPSDISCDILAHKDEVIEILTLTTDARPSARGKPKPRKSKTSELPNIEPKAA